MLKKKLQKKLLCCMLAGCFAVPSAMSVEAARKGPHQSKIGSYQNIKDEPFGCNTGVKVPSVDNWPATSANDNRGYDYAETPSRIKYTDSSVYVWIKKVKDSYSTFSTNRSRIRISTGNCGYKDGTTWGADTRAYGSNGSLYYTGKYRYLNLATEYLVYNYVFEDAALALYQYGMSGSSESAAYSNTAGGHYTYTTLSFHFDRIDSNNKVYGLWSPDSIATSSTVATWGQSW